MGSMAERQLRAKALREQRGPDRPSHFNEDANVRVPRETLDVDYPTESYTPPTFGDKPVPDPVLVSVIDPIPAAQRLVRFAAMTLDVVAGQVETVGGADRNRQKLIVQNNDDATSIYVLGGEFDIAANGFRVLPGEQLEMKHTAEVYVRNLDAVETVNISVYTEYSVPES